MHYNSLMILYIQPVCGASGDMLLSGVIDLIGASEHIAQKVKMWGKIEVEDVKEGALQGKRMRILTKRARFSSDKLLSEVKKVEISEPYKTWAVETILGLICAEEEIHGSRKLHELGDLDTLVDVVGFFAGLEELGVRKVFCAPVPIAFGVQKTEHGTLPVPTPLTLKLLEGFPVREIHVEGETVTPTAAGIIRACAKPLSSRSFTLSRTGVGFGAKRFDIPNVLRLILGEGFPIEEELFLVQTNVDDMPPEFIPRIFSVEAVDVWIETVIMKKGRPGFVINILCHNFEEVLDVIFRETTSIGVRVIPVKRYPLEREVKVKEFEGENVKVKVARYKGETINVKAEFEDIVKISDRTGIPLKIIKSKIESEF